MLVAVTCDCFNLPVKHSLFQELAVSRRLFQEWKELSKPSVTCLGVPCATSVPLSAHHQYPARHLAACRPFWASWLIFACHPQQCWKAALSACQDISVNVPQHQWGLLLATGFPSGNKIQNPTTTTTTKYYVWETKEKRKKDGVAGRDHCWLLQNKR